MRKSRDVILVVTVVLFAVLSSNSSAQSPQGLAEILITNATNGDLVFRGIDKREKIGFYVVVPPGETRGGNEFLPGTRVVAVWQAQGDAAVCRVVKLNAGDSKKLTVQPGRNGQLEFESGGVFYSQKTKR